MSFGCVIHEGIEALKTLSHTIFRSWHENPSFLFSVTPSFSALMTYFAFTRFEKRKNFFAFFCIVSHTAIWNTPEFSKKSCDIQKKKIFIIFGFQMSNFSAVSFHVVFIVVSPSKSTAAKFTDDSYVYLISDTSFYNIWVPLKNNFFLVIS